MHNKQLRIITCNNDDNCSYVSVCFSELTETLQTKYLEWVHKSSSSKSLASSFCYPLENPTQVNQHRIEATCIIQRTIVNANFNNWMYFKPFIDERACNKGMLYISIPIKKRK